MKRIVRKWQLGWMVIFRCIHFYLFLVLFGLPFVLVGKFLAAWIVNLNPLLQTVIAVPYILILMPIVFYWQVQAQAMCRDQIDTKFRKWLDRELIKNMIRHNQINRPNSKTMY